MEIKTKEIFNSLDKVDIRKYLSLNHIEDIEEYLKPTGKYIEPPSLYENMDKGVDWINNMIKNVNEESKIYILQDCDCDGVCSSVLVYRFLMSLNVNEDYIKVIFHEGKRHGLADVMNQINADCGFIWIPDASSDDHIQTKILVNQGVEVLITDHHASSESHLHPSNVVVINNQLSPNVRNKALCGAGVTWKLIGHYGSPLYSSDIDIVALANIGDSMDVKDQENRMICKWGLSHLNNKFLIELCKAFCSNINRDIIQTDLSWNVIPKINAVCRCDNQETKRNMFFAFVHDVNYIDTITQMKSCHSQQSYRTGKMFDKYKDIAEKNTNKICCLNIENTAYTGMLANKFCQNFNKPFFLVHPQNGQFIGSCRSPVDLRTALSKSNLMTVCRGHEQAFGVGWKMENTKKLNEFIQSLDLEKFNKATEVFCKTRTSELITKEDLFETMEKVRDLWGSKLPEPMLLIEDVRVFGTNIKELGTNGIKFRVGTINFIKFGLSKKDKESLGVGQAETLSFDILGSLQINRWNEHEDPQIDMKHIQRNKI